MSYARFTGQLEKSPGPLVGSKRFAWFYKAKYPFGFTMIGSQP